MAERVALFLQSATFEPVYQAATLALTAAAMGDEVWVVLGFAPLRALAEGALGAASGEVEREESVRASQLHLPAPAAMLAEARALGVRVVACDTLARLAGVNPSQLALLDETLGLPSIWRYARSARTMTF
jgi:peroxiredoxin family protein